MCMVRYTDKLPCPTEVHVMNLTNNSTDGNCTETWNSYELDVRNEYHPLYSVGNFSEMPFPNDIWIHRPTWEIVTKSVIFIPIVIAGIIGNLLLLHVILRNRRLRTPTNLLIANMAAADLATLLICPWMFMCSDFFQNFILGELGCKTEGFFECALLLTGVFSLCAVSYDRLTAIVLPCEARLSCRGARIVMATTWVLGALIGMPLIFYRIYKERQWMDFLEKFCMENVHVLPTYWHVIIALLVWVPLAVMAICYSAIFIKLDLYEQQVLRRGREHPMSVNFKTRVARMLFIVLSVFIICRLPFTVFVFWRNRNIRENHNTKMSTQVQVSDGFLILWSVSHYLIFSNAAINPLIYGLTNDNFKREFRNTTLSCWLFGPVPLTNQNPVLPQAKKPKVKVVEPLEACVVVEEDNDEKSRAWFTEPKCKMKTVTTDCYM